MLIDDLHEKLKQSEPDLFTIKQFWTNGNFEEEFQNLLKTSTQENFWQNPYRTVSKLKTAWNSRSG